MTKTKTRKWSEKTIAKALERHGFDAYARDTLVTHEKVPALVYIDDRGYRFDGSNFPSADDVHRQLIPWNKRPMGLKT